MFTRVVECVTKPGKTEDYCKTLRNEVLPILKKQLGFEDEIVLVSSSKPSHILAMSFWRSPLDAERYKKEQYPEVLQILKPLLKENPKVETFDLDTSTMHHIMAGKAA